MSVAMAVGLSACGSKSDTAKTGEESKTTTEAEPDENPTGYPEGEAQRICVMYDNNLYVYDDAGRDKVKESDISETYPEYTHKEKIVNDSNDVPVENLHGAHISDGADLYVNPENKDVVLVYDLGEIMKMKLDK